MYLPKEKSLTGVQLSCEREFKRIFKYATSVGRIGFVPILFLFKNIIVYQQSLRLLFLVYTLKLH